MIGKRNLLIGIILGALIGWTLGFLRLPFIDKNFSFLVGFIACLALVSIGLIFIFIWNKNSLLIKLLSKNSTAKDSKNATRTYAVVWILVSLFIVLGGVASSFLIFNQNKLFKAQTQTQNKRIQEQSELIESIRKSNLVFLMSNILDKVDDELKNNPEGTLSNATIARIAALSYSFKPYRYLEGDSLSENKLSPERGQLLLALSIMNIDSSSFNKIKFKTPFSEADLRGVNLRGVNLRGADLKEADLKEADLRKTNLEGADLRGANLWGANLKEADLSGADLKRADLRWADMNGADLSNADLNGADFTSSKLKGANLIRASSRWADFSSALLNEANLEGIELVGSNLSKANFNMANLSDADLRYTDMSQADLRETDLNGAIIEKDWFEKLKKWKIIGSKEIQTRNKIIEDSSVLSNYRLELIED